MSSMQNAEFAVEVDAPRELIEWSIKQDAIYGFPLDLIAYRNRVDIDTVEQVLSASPEFKENMSQRKKLALARLDLATKALMPKLIAGDHPAINTYLKIQEREARLTGMDNPSKHDTTLTIDIPWITRDRLAYKDSKGQAIENVTDITPILEVKKAAESVQDTQRTKSLVQDTHRPWKSPPPEQGLGHILRSEDLPES